MFASISLISATGYSQESLKDFSTKDSIKREELQFKNFFRSSSKKLLGKDDLFGLELYEKTIDDSLFITYPNTSSLYNYSKDELSYFKETFQQLMEIARRNHHKYDLGEVGRYLGISRKIMAVILAIISVAK